MINILVHTLQDRVLIEGNREMEMPICLSKFMGGKSSKKKEEVIKVVVKELVGEHCYRYLNVMIKKTLLNNKLNKRKAILMTYIEGMI